MCFFVSHLFSASWKVTASGATGGGVTGQEAACGDRPFPASVSGELMKLGLAVVAVGFKRQLKQGAGGPCCPGRGSQVCRDSRSQIACKQAEEGGPQLDHDKAAASLRALPPAPRCRGDVARLDVSPWVGFPCTR